MTSCGGLSLEYIFSKIRRDLSCLGFQHKGPISRDSRIWVERKDIVSFIKRLARPGLALGCPNLSSPSPLSLLFLRRYPVDIQSRWLDSVLLPCMTVLLSLSIFLSVIVILCMTILIYLNLLAALPILFQPVSPAWASQPDLPPQILLVPVS